MASGRTLLEVDEKKPPGFFPKLYENVVYNMGKEKLEEMEKLTDDPESLIRFTYSLDNFKKALTVSRVGPLTWGNGHIKCTLHNISYFQGLFVSLSHKS